MDRRVVITGIGGIAPNGNSPQEIFQSAVHGKSGIRVVTKFLLDANHVCRVAGEVDFHWGLIDRVLGKDFKRIAPAAQYSMYAIRQALADSRFKFDRLDPEEAQRIGICMGASIIGMSEVIEQVRNYSESGARRISLFLIQKIMPSAVAARPSMHEGIHGPSYTTSAACASSAMSMIDAYNLIVTGECNAVITGGGEDAIDPISLASFGNMRALSRDWNDQPERALRPFDSKRNGFVPSEGGVAFVFEELSHALLRKAPIYAEVVGHCRNSDAYDIVHPDPGAFWQSLCMKTALNRAGVHPSELSYINAHATGTVEGDTPESIAIAAALGDAADKIPVSSTKGVTGHLMSAAAAIELLMCVMAINEGVIPPTTNLDVVDPACAGIKHVQNPIKTNVDVAMSNSFGFGGPNTAIVVKRFTR
jgi:3-oxoacyl-(acyl-carrier-protein) synthase